MVHYHMTSINSYKIATVVPEIFNKIKYLSTRFLFFFSKSFLWKFMWCILWDIHEKYFFRPIPPTSNNFAIFKSIVLSAVPIFINLRVNLRRFRTIENQQVTDFEQPWLIQIASLSWKLRSTTFRPWMFRFDSWSL